MFGRVFFFGIGLYTGIVINQGYNIPAAPKPDELWQKVKEFVEDQKNSLSPEDKAKIGNILDSLKKMEKDNRKD